MLQIPFTKIISILFQMIIDILELLLSEGYCYYMDVLAISYYNPKNRKHVFPPIINSKIDDLSEGDARDMTGLSVAQLRNLYDHFRIEDEFVYRRRYFFTGKEYLLHYLVFNRTGEGKLWLSRSHFGGDPCHFTYSIRMMTTHLYNTFYNKISGDSMRMWMLDAIC